MRIAKSRSLSSLSSAVSTPSSYSSDYTRSSWTLSEPAPLPVIKRPDSSSVSKKDHKNRKSQILCTRYTCVPCLSGDVNAADEHGRSLLFYAARYDQADPTRQLLQAGCDPNIKDNFGMTPLHEAVERGSFEVAKVLLKEGEGIDVDSLDGDGQTPFLMAVTLGQIEAVRLLHKYGANINKTDKFGISPLHRAIDSGWEDIVDFLLDNSCDVKNCSASETCFSAIVHNSRLSPIKYAKRLLKTDYDFKQDADWLEADDCPEQIKEHSKVYFKLLIRAGLRNPSKKSSFVKSKLIKTIRQLSR